MLDNKTPLFFLAGALDHRDPGGPIRYEIHMQVSSGWVLLITVAGVSSIGWDRDPTMPQHASPRNDGDLYPRTPDKEQKKMTPPLTLPHCKDLGAVTVSGLPSMDLWFPSHQEGNYGQGIESCRVKACLVGAACRDQVGLS